jgi:outer membrane protein assembly factor BamB
MFRRHRILLAVVAGLVVLLAAGAGIAWWAVHRTVGDVHNGASLPFTLSSSAPSSTDPSEPGSTTKAADRFGPDWPLYGRVEQRTRDASDMTRIKPPFRTVWKMDQHALIEFPPSYHRGVLFLGRDDGWVLALDVKTGDVKWKRRFGPVPNQPAYWNKKVIFGTFDKPGWVYGLDARNGQVRWKTRLSDQVESSMVVSDGKVYTGCNDGTVRALDAETGRVLWTYRASGAVKASIAVDGGRLFFGSYGGNMYSLRARDGHVLWKSGTSGLAGGFRSGNFYSSPAVAYGRVYLGNTDGKVYSFVAATGQLAWTSTLPYWAYGSPGTAFGNVYATSFDGTVAAMDGRTGDRLWTRKLPFRSLSSATIIGHLVYVADMGNKSRPGHTYALDPRTGAIRWRFHDGEYHGPIVADNMLILPGFTTLYALRPRGLKP